MVWMGDTSAHTAESWALPERSRPPLLSELIERIDEAMATARASEAAVMTVGAAALDAAEQAKRAAELAERASAAIAAPAPIRMRSTSAGRPAPRPFEPARSDEMSDFNARADRVAERLQRLEQLSI